MPPLTLPDVLCSAASQHGDTTAVDVAGDRRISYRDLHRSAARISSFLDTAVAPGAHVAVLMPNSAAWVEALYGSAQSDRAAVLLNPRLTVPELVYQLAQSDTELAFVDGLPPDQRTALQEECPGIVFMTTDEARGTDAPPAPDAHPDSTAVIIYTSGTTSAPKGVELSHRAIVRNAAGVADRFALRGDDRVFGAGPFFHSGGLTMHIVLCALRGAQAHSIVRFDPDAVVELVVDRGITIYSGIETLFLRLPTAADFTPAMMRTVRTGWTTGTPAILEIIRDTVGIPGIIGVYGISEAGPNVLMSSADDPEHLRLATVGRPLDGVEARIVDLASGQDLEDGQPGELLVRSPSLMNGYYARPDETALALRDGWLRTGDILVRRPDGYFEFAGRSKDTVRTVGENVSCAEVEDAIYARTDVALTAVVALPNAERGEIVAAAIVPGGARTVTTAAQLIEALSPHLATYKLPRHVAVLNELPMTASGKVRKPELIDMLLDRGGHA